ncbi:ABC transporter ATP-binding protein [Hydrogenimonas urashimensis]|uniref:ABC transporter ATP-binding protein n=1 Tax=Hydrogenimonas urashimensis TaxID=2740515 RepID=UPI001F3C55EF|nr:ABC transporter ATP-binding protein [Hydrogenimonas urashimensis]
MSLKEFFSAYLPLYRNYKEKIAYMVAGMVLTSAATGAIAYMVKPLMDRIFIEKDIQMLYVVPVFIIAAFVAKGLGTYMQGYAMSYVGHDIVRQLRDRLLSHMMHLDMDFHAAFHSGELISRINNDIERIKGAISSQLASFLRESLTAIVLLGVVIYQSPKLALYTLIIVPMVAWPVDYLSKKLKKLSHRSQEKNADLMKQLSENFANYEMIQSYNAQNYELVRFEHYNRDFFETNMKTVKVQLALTPILELVAAIAITIFIVIGGREVLINKTMTTGEFFSFLTALSLLIDPIRRISNLYGQFQNAVAAHERIQQILRYKPMIRSGEKCIDHVETIAFENVTLRYGDTVALKEISMTARKGEVVGLVGDSGGGKSSMVNLILRFYDPAEGSVKINGIDARDIDLKSLRSRIAIVTQRIYIANDTILANVAYGDTRPDRKKAIEALKKANLWSFVETLPEGIETILQEGGTNLSGGQRQRIAIARALYKEPDILILDEATSALDNKSEAAIMETIYALRNELIVFIVAHRLSTIENADTILVFEHGKIVCRGTKEELARGCVTFQNLYRKEKGVGT